MQSLAAQLENPRSAGQRQARKGGNTSSTTPVVVEFRPRSPEEIQRARASRLALLARGKTTQLNEELVNAIIALRMEERDYIALTRQHDADRRVSPSGSTQLQLANEAMATANKALEQTQQELRHYQTESPAEYSEAVRRDMFAQGDYEYASSLVVLDPESVRADEIRAHIATAAENRYIRPANETEDPLFSWDRQGYLVADESAPNTANTLAALIRDFQNVRNDRAAVTIDGMKRNGFFISAMRTPKDSTNPKSEMLPSEIDLLREEQDVFRSVSEFLAARAGRYIVKVGHEFIVLDQRGGGKVAVIKGSGDRTGNNLFFIRDQKTQERVPRFPNRPLVFTITIGDMSDIRNDQLREALENDVRRETESAGRREAAFGLRDVSQVQNLITLYALSKGAVGTSVVNARVGERETLVTCHLTSDGKTFQVSQQVEGSIAKVDPNNRWLGKAVNNPQPISVFERGWDWKGLVRANAWFDRDWMLSREAQRQNATIVNRDNVRSVVEVEGQDGLYAFRVNDHKSNAGDPNRSGEIREWKVPLGYVVRREGTKVTFVYSVPGPSAGKIEKMGGTEHDVANLGSVTRAVFRNLLFANRAEGERIEVPSHLASLKRTEASE